MEKLQGKIAVVTAATKGIGLASAEILAKNGATVYLAARSEELANEVINKISAEGGCAKFVYFNAREEETFTSMIEEVVKKEGKIDILVNNFGSTNP
ncbi:SDR family NAD(P)-dependent oxidoreductase, partial [Clostridioides difficile]